MEQIQLQNYRDLPLEKYLRALPGILTWILLSVITLLSFIAPEVVAYILLVYALYWVFRTFAHITRLTICFFHVLKDTSVDWLKRCSCLDGGEGVRLQELEQEIDDWWYGIGIRKFRSLRLERLLKVLSLPLVFVKDQEGFKSYIKKREEFKALKRYVRHGARPRFCQVRHLVIVPTYKEGIEVLRPSFEHLVRSHFPLDRVYVILATEEADEEAPLVVAELRKFFGKSLPHLYVSRHQLLPGEVAGKSSNQAYAIRWFEREVMGAEQISKEHLLVTSLDADYRVHPEYFANLSFKYLTDPKRQYHIYQPIPMFFNNIWRVNMFSRIEATLSTQIQMARQLDQRENRNFSSYAAAFPTIEKAGFWDEAVIQEDSRLYWRVFFAWGEKVRVEPLFLPVFGEAVHSRSYMQSVRSLYEQMRRWAWGASDVPFVMIGCFLHPEIPFRIRLRAIWDVISNYLNWATMPLILGFGALFPLYFSPQFGQTVMAYNLPVFTSRLLTVTSIATVFLLVIDTILTPPKPKQWSSLQKAMTYAQWLTMPVIGIIFGAMPAIDAQTKMMVGKNLEYKVTEKGA